MVLRIHPAWLLMCWLLAATLPAQASEFSVDYHVRFLPEQGVAEVTLQYRPGTGRLRELDFRIDPERYDGFHGDGKLERSEERLVWQPPRRGGALYWRYRIDRQRRDAGYDARMTQNWVIVRGDHLVPSFRTRLTAGAQGQARLHFELPQGWGVDTPFKREGSDPVFLVATEERRLPRPVGWMIAGELGIRREFISGMEVAVAAPRGDSMRRNDYLAVINLVIPQMEQAFGQLPEKILIVGAGDPMWRGGLSGPRSMYLHSDRPLISENGTSTLVHELVHLVTRIRGAEGDDWIAEGLAEYYSITLLRRTGLLSDMRADRALDWMRNHGRDIESLRSDRSYGRHTARAVTLLAELDAEIRSKTDEAHSLDDVVRLLLPLRRVSTAQLREAVESILGAPSLVLDSDLL